MHVSISTVTCSNVLSTPFYTSGLTGVSCGFQVRPLGETVRLDARTKLLNPKWYEGMLNSGYEGVREIQKRLTNTVGWSATSGQVRPVVCNCSCP